MYYDSRSDQAFTRHGIAQRGLPVLRDALARAGIYPLTYTYPPHDQRLYTLAPLPVEVRNEIAHQGFRIEQLPLEQARANALKWVADQRWQAETGGIDVGGVRVLTAIEDQNRIDATIQGMELAGITEVDFKSADGWVKLSPGQIKGLAAAIAQHVEQCFSRERELCELVDAAETVAEIETVLAGGF